MRHKYMCGERVERLDGGLNDSPLSFRIICLLKLNTQ